MLTWCARQYAKRIVNVNINIVLAGVMAAFLTSLALTVLRAWTSIEQLDKKWQITITLSIDLVLDVIIAMGLHWLASHLPRRLNAARKMVDAADRVIDAAPPTISFIKDATTIQFQRLCLSPVLYGTVVGVQWLLLHEGVALNHAAFIALVAGIVVTRCLHTPWLLYSDRKVWEQWEAATKARGENNLPIVPGLSDLHLPQGLKPKAPNAAAMEDVKKDGRVKNAE